MTRAQARALEQLWPRFGIDAGKRPLDLDALFGRHAPRVLEIGFGNGEALAELAARHPETDFLGVEVHEPGVGHLLLALQTRHLTNVRVIREDAIEILGDWLPERSVDRVNLFFPDPWPKKRHHKRRIVQPDFMVTVARVLTPGGILHMATDWENYAEQMLAVANDSPLFENMASGGGYSPRPPDRPRTKFETRGHRMGHEVRDLLYKRLPGPVTAGIPV